MSYGRYNPDVKRVEYKHPPYVKSAFEPNDPTPFSKEVQEALDVVTKEECQSTDSLQKLSNLVKASLCVRRYKEPKQECQGGYFSRHPHAYNNFYPVSPGDNPDHNLDLGEVKEGLKGREAINYLRDLEKEQLDRWNFSYASPKEVFTEIVQKQFYYHEEKLLIFEPTLKLEADLLKLLESFIEFHVLVDNVLDPETKESRSTSYDYNSNHKRKDRIFVLRNDAPLLEVYEKHPWVFVPSYNPKESMRFDERQGYGDDSVGGSAVIGTNRHGRFIPAEDEKWFHVSEVEKEWTEKMYYEKPAWEVAQDRRDDEDRSRWAQNRRDREQSKIFNDAYK